MAPPSATREPIIGVDLGGTKTAVILGTPNGEVLARRQFPTTPADTCLPRIFAAIRELSPAPRAIGIACGGPLDTRTGSLLSPPNLPGWERCPLVSLFQNEMKCPATLVNDANAGALAEWRWGAGRGKSDLIFLTCGTGMGAGIISGGRLLAGAGGNAGEIGHVRLTDTGPVGYGKVGSVEAWTSGGGLGRWAVSNGWPAETDGKAIVLAATRGDGKAIALLSHMGARMGQTLAILIDLFNPECIALGSFYIRAQPFLDPSLRKTLGEECLSESLAACEVVPAKLGDGIGDAQALAAALQVNRP